MIKRVYFSNYNFHRIILILLGGLLYFAALDNWYAGFARDDDWMIYENPNVFHLSLANIANYFTSFYKYQYSSFNTLAYGLIYCLFGISHLYFHSFSLQLDLCNTLLVLDHIRKVSNFNLREIPIFDLNIDSSRIAFMMTLLFIIQPLQVEAIVWVNVSKLLLYSFLYLLILIIFLRYVTTTRVIFSMLTIMFFMLAYGLNGYAVFFFLILLYWFLKRKLKSIKMILGKLQFFILSLGFSTIAMHAHQVSVNIKLKNDSYV